ncbi:hypothetical protein BKA62DRAFT_720978 [Auriculariales sp. MPI-PUGE-AT-0066]|nr:hypothetical protein BKA62DRAFT_720978 [Auriculariales sp. MPI-PUGE-AT-0066]
MAAAPNNVSPNDQAHSTSSAYVYDDKTVCLSIGERQMKISRKRLTDASPIFADMFQLPSMNDEPVQLLVDPTEFEHFLWYLHVSPLDFIKWDQESTGDARFRRVLGIAAIAHMYQSEGLAAWAVAQILKLLPTKPITDTTTLKRLYDFSSRADGLDPQLQTQSLAYWCGQVRESSDPVEWLLAAKDRNDQYLQAYAYLHILKRTGLQVTNDTRLTGVDRLRLLFGATNLRRFSTVPARYTECPCPNPRTHYNNGRCIYWSQPIFSPPEADQRELPIIEEVPLQDKYGPLTLWEIFTHSTVGVLLIEDSEPLNAVLAKLAV